MGHVRESPAALLFNDTLAALEIAAALGSNQKKHAIQ